MAGRIRTIKPELIATPRFAQLTDAAARLFLGCYSLADDAGNCPAGPSYLAGQIFYARARSATVIGRLLGELEAGRLVDLYKVDGASYLAILGWSEKYAPTHQRIEKPQPPRFPLPSSVRSWNEFPDHSWTDSDQRPQTGTGTRTGTLSESKQASSAVPPAPSGWEPPAGGQAQKIAEQRIAHGELTAEEVAACWAAMVSKHAKLTDAIAAAWIAKQRPQRKAQPLEQVDDSDYEAKPW